MPREDVIRVFAKLIVDPEFKKSFFTDKKKALEEGGFKLTPPELDALLVLKESDIVIKERPGPPYDVIIPVKKKPVLPERPDIP